MEGLDRLLVALHVDLTHPPVMIMLVVAHLVLVVIALAESMATVTAARAGSTMMTVPPLGPTGLLLDDPLWMTIPLHLHDGPMKIPIIESTPLLRTPMAPLAALMTDPLRGTSHHLREKDTLGRDTHQGTTNVAADTGNTPPSPLPCVGSILLVCSVFFTHRGILVFYVFLLLPSSCVLGRTVLDWR